MKAARIKIEKNQEQYQGQNIINQNVVNLGKKKNKPQEVVVNDTMALSKKLCKFQNRLYIKI